MLRKSLKGMMILIVGVILAFSLIGCGDDGGGGPTDGSDPDLSGSITITPNSGVTTGTELTAIYTGIETVTYQWKRGSTNVGTNAKYTPDQAGSYTVTVSATGYKSKISSAVTVTTGGGGGLPSTGPGTGGDPTLSNGYIWVDDARTDQGILFEGSNYCHYYLSGGTWGSRSVEGTWTGNAITRQDGPNSTFTVSGDRLAEYSGTTRVATYTKTAGTIQGQ